ncbi:glycosyltransferase family 4 protein [Tahibacter amnicola]|uniref:Glycosyltransferase family 4 protein n=1 Tax=Tahibacter amnicola TaxID=2976241 RepID=A0ABY6B8C9_9GAMM|nr:glycosyltransferase family 4 protein [Tahibacter amnicola]UXI66338.1 glycosyltransferase family 4 protein [Tahibacter amnicola]
MTSQPQRVLYIVSLFPCWSETFIVREIEQLLAHGVDVRILSLKRPSETLVQARAAALMDRVVGPPSFPAALVAVTMQVLRRPLRMAGVLGTLVAQLWRSPVSLAKSLVALWRGIGALPAIRRQDPQLIHAHWATYPSTVAWALGRLADTPFSFTCHAHDIFIEDQLLRRKLSDAALAVTISGFNRRHLARWGAAEAGERLQVVHCGVDFAELPAQESARRDGAIVSVGRLDPIKGFDVLIAALGTLRERGVPFDCHLIGEGPLRPRLEAQRRSLQLEPVLSLPGAQPQEKVRSALVEASIFVMPSVVTPEGNQDGIPVALMEAMACGMAVVGTRVSGIPELIEHDVSGILVEPGDSQALAGAIERLLSDAALRQRLGAVARERVRQDFNVAAETRRLLSLFGRALHPQGAADAR